MPSPQGGVARDTPWLRESGVGRGGMLFIEICSQEIYFCICHRMLWTGRAVCDGSTNTGTRVYVKGLGGGVVFGGFLCSAKRVSRTTIGRGCCN